MISIIQFPRSWQNFCSRTKSSDPEISMTTAKRVAKNTFYVLLAQIINKIFNMIFIVYSARLLGAKLYGIFVLVNTMVLISSTFTNCGIRAMIVRKISKDYSRAAELLSNILSLRLCLSAVVYLLLALFVNLSSYPTEIKTLVYIAGIVIVFNIFTNSFEIIYISFEKMKMLSVFATLSSLSFTILAIIVLASGYKLKALFSINVLVGAIFAVSSGYFIWKHFVRFNLKFDLHLITNILMQSLPFFAAIILNILNTKIDIMMLSTIKGPIDSNFAVGYYAPAHNILLGLMIFPRSLNTALLPVISQKIYSDHEFVRESVEKATRFVMIGISFPIILATTFFSKEVVTVIFGPDYIQSASALMILGWAYAFYALNIPTHSVLGSSKELKHFLPLLFCVFVLNIVLNYILIPKYSYIGASVATLTVLFLGFIGRFFFLRKILEVKVSEIKGYLKLLLVLGLSLGCVFLIKSFLSWPVLVISTITIYFLFLYVFRCIKKDEITFFSNWVLKRFN